MRPYTYLKSFETVAFLGGRDGKVYVVTPEFAMDKAAPIKHDAVAVSSLCVALPRNAALNLHRYVHSIGKPYFEGGDGSYVELWCIFDEVDKVWYIRDSEAARLC
jgi:hypothetical protein